MSLSVGLFCGSRAGRSAGFAQAAADLGAGIAARGWKLVYGGGDVGLMGLAARAALAGGAEVTGIIPRRLVEREAGKRDIAELVVTATMHERKALMIDAAHAFVVLPGGLGTLDELLEVVTLKQLGYHRKPILLVDVEGYWRGWDRLVGEVVAAGFAERSAPALTTTVGDVPAALAALDAHGADAA